MKLGDLRGYALLITLSIIWGLAFVAIRRADFELSSVNLTLLRWLIVAGFFLVLYPFIGRPKTPFEWKDAPRLAAVAVASVDVYHLSLNFAEKTVDASLAGLLISLAPVFIVLLSTVVLKERVTRRVALALAVALTGAVIISLPDLSLGYSSALGPLAVVLSALANGIYSVGAKPLIGKYGAFTVAMWAGILGTAFLLPLLSWGFVLQAEQLSLGGWAAVLYLSILSTVGANLIFYTLVGRNALTRLGVQLYIIPLVSVTGGILILGESLTTLTVLGGAVLLMGVYLATSARR